MQAESHPRHHVDESETNRKGIADRGVMLRRMIYHMWLCLLLYAISVPHASSESLSLSQFPLSLCSSIASDPTPVPPLLTITRYRPTYFCALLSASNDNLSMNPGLLDDNLVIEP
jgi:hypothetical protein